MSLKLIHIAVSLAFMLPLSSTTPCRSQESDTASSRSSTNADIRFYTPQATVTHWVQSVNKRNWREEYNCYTGTQQANFTYKVMVSTRELSDSQDLTIELSRTLQSYSFASKLLDEFPSTRMDLSNLHDPKSKQSAIEEQNEKRQEQLIRWEREIQPLDIDWAGMIEDLQPLMIQNYQRHELDIHPSQTGIAHHLHYHRFDPPSSIKVVGNRAEGTIIAVVCDPDIMVDKDADEREPKGLKAISSWLDRGIQKLPFRERRVKRSPEKLSLVREVEGWKIDSVPYR